MDPVCPHGLGKCQLILQKHKTISLGNRSTLLVHLLFRAVCCVSYCRKGILIFNSVSAVNPKSLLNRCVFCIVLQERNLQPPRPTLALSDNFAPQSKTPRLQLFLQHRKTDLQRLLQNILLFGFHSQTEVCGRLTLCFDRYSSLFVTPS